MGQGRIADDTKTLAGRIEAFFGPRLVDGGPGAESQFHVAGGCLHNNAGWLRDNLQQDAEHWP